MQKLQYLRKEILKTAYLGFILLIIAHTPIGTIQKVSIVNASDLKATDLKRIQIGTSAPDFTLESADGNWIKLSSYQNRKNVILVFYRGYW